MYGLRVGDKVEIETDPHEGWHSHKQDQYGVIMNIDKSADPGKPSDPIRAVIDVTWQDGEETREFPWTLRRIA